MLCMERGKKWWCRVFLKSSKLFCSVFLRNAEVKSFPHSRLKLTSLEQPHRLTLIKTTMSKNTVYITKKWHTWPPVCSLLRKILWAARWKQVRLWFRVALMALITALSFVSKKLELRFASVPLNGVKCVSCNYVAWNVFASVCCQVHFIFYIFLFWNFRVRKRKPSAEN